MRYRLRTLLIVVTAIAIGLGVFCAVAEAYCRHHEWMQEQLRNCDIEPATDPALLSQPPSD
jgi:hypothetical protein